MVQPGMRHVPTGREIWPGVPHAFQMADFLPEATLAIDHIAHFVQMHTGWSEANARPVPAD